MHHLLLPASALNHLLSVCHIIINSHLAFISCPLSVILPTTYYLSYLPLYRSHLYTLFLHRFLACSPSPVQSNSIMFDTTTTEHENRARNLVYNPKTETRKERTSPCRSASLLSFDISNRSYLTTLNASKHLRGNSCLLNDRIN